MIKQATIYYPGDPSVGIQASSITVDLGEWPEDPDDPEGPTFERDRVRAILRVAGFHLFDGDVSVWFDNERGES